MVASKTNCAIAITNRMSVPLKKEKCRHLSEEKSKQNVFIRKIVFDH